MEEMNLCFPEEPKRWAQCELAAVFRESVERTEDATSIPCE